MLFCFTRRNRNGTPPSFVGTGRSKPESHWKSKGSHLASNQLALLRLVRVLGRMRTSSMFRGRAGEKQTVVLLMKHDSISDNVRRIERIFFFFVRGGAFFFWNHLKANDRRVAVLFVAQQPPVQLELERPIFVVSNGANVIFRFVSFSFLMLFFNNEFF